MDCVIDTIVFIQLFRKHQTALSRQVIALVERDEAAICGQVWVEFLGGFGNERRRQDYAQRLSAYTWLNSPREAYRLAADLCAKYRGIGPGDAVIAATVIVNNASLLALDIGFNSLVSEGLKLASVERRQ